MNKSILTLALIATISLYGFINIESSVVYKNGIPQTLKSDEVAKGLIEALKVGAKNAAEKASKVDGFYKNSEIFIPFPQDAIKVKNTLVKAGLTKQVTEFEQSINRAAEEAAKKALPIFTDAIKGMTFSDAMGILKGSNNSATNYLKEKTTKQLKEAFKPVVKESIKKALVTKYWENVASAYSKINVLAGGKKVKPDLEGYITDKAIDGLFILIAKEEEQIRTNPKARVTDILKNVFGK